MASASSALNALLSSTGSTVAPVTFSGVSSYASDLQQVMARTVAIATLPLTQIQNNQAIVESKFQALLALNPSVAAVGADITAIGTLAASKSLSASSSNPALVSVTATGATATANYTISNITSVASAASATSATSYGDGTTQVSSAGNLNLVVGGTAYPITLGPGQNNLQGLVTAINGQNAGVTASILTTKDGAYLAISANSTGELTALQLNDTPVAGPAVNLLNTVATGLNLGTNANFKLNGTSISQSNNTINNVVSGLTFTILGTTTVASQTVNLSLSQDSSKVVSALQSFVNDYNSLHAAVNGHVGQNGGALTGNSLLFQVESAMQQAVTYGATTGAVRSLADLGVTLDNTGTMTLDPTVLSSMTSTQVDSALQFLGTPTTGLGALASSFTQISDPITGMIKIQEDNYQIQDQNLQIQVNNRTDQINTLQINLQKRLELADAAISALETQAQILTSSIQAVDLALYGQNYGTASKSG